MKSEIASYLLIAASLQSFSATVSSGPLPPCEFADTETSTNCMFSTARTGSQVLSFQISLLASPSNNVEIAIGQDANADGMLSADETAMVVGWDCGEWSVRNDRCKHHLRADASTDDASKTLVWEVYGINGSARAIKATENGHPIDFGLDGCPPDWTFSDSWDLARFVVRGVDSADETYLARFFANGTSVRVR